MKDLKDKLFDKYMQLQKLTLAKHFEKLKTIDVSDFGYHISMSAVYSSMIEGNTLNFDDYYKIEETGMNKTSKQYIEIKDLKRGYEIASKSEFNIENMLNIHSIITQNIIQEKKYRGNFRDKDVYVMKGRTKIYTGAEPSIVLNEVTKLQNDIYSLMKEKLSIDEAFFFASLIHLIFVKIHPFADGNGRVARLLEKWFLARILGDKAWFIQSEKYYQKYLNLYYKNLQIGKDYTQLDLGKSLPFLLMLPKSLRLKGD